MYAVRKPPGRRQKKEFSMEDQRNIHWRVGGKLTHCGIECLPGGRDIERIVIARIEYKDTEMINGRTESGVWVAYFAQNPYTNLPFILNATNRKRLVKLYPQCEGYIARLENVAVRLTKEETRDVQDGGTTWGLRISKIPASPEKAAKPAKKKPLTADRVEGCVKWMKENGKTMEDVAEMYELSEEIKDAIIDAYGPVPGADDGDLPL